VQYDIDGFGIVVFSTVMLVVSIHLSNKNLIEKIDCQVRSWAT
jgi:hypothetical protein